MRKTTMRQCISYNLHESPIFLSPFVESVRNIEQVSMLNKEGVVGQEITYILNMPILFSIPFQGRQPYFLDGRVYNGQVLYSRC